MFMENISGQGGKLFGTINYASIDSLESFLSNLNIQQSLYVLGQSLEFANNQGIFSLQESEILSKSLRILNKEIYNIDDRKNKE